MHEGYFKVSKTQNQCEVINDTNRTAQSDKEGSCKTNCASGQASEGNEHDPVTEYGGCLEWVKICPCGKVTCYSDSGSDPLV